MLVLSRQVGEVIVIGGGIAVTVVEIRGDKVWLGVEAPREVAVDRAEIRAAKDLCAAQLAAAGEEFLAAMGGG